METIAKVATAMHRVLSTTADRAARATGCVQRVRAFTGATFVQTLVFGWLAHPDATLDQLCQTAAARGVAITPQGLDARFTAAAACLHQVVEATVTEVIATDPAALPLLERFAAVVVHDSTVIRLPDPLQPVWTGCGGGDAAGAGTQAALKVQAGLDLRTGTLPGLALAPGRAQDQDGGPDPAALPAGALVLTDLGYFNLDRLTAQSAAGQFWLTRPKVHTVVQPQDAEPTTLPALLTQTPAPRLDVSIRLGAQHRLPARLVAARVPPAVAAARRRALHEAARKKGQPVSQARLVLADWVVYVTNVPPTVLTAAEVLVLGRVRWQVELVFRRWTSLGQVDAWGSTTPWRILCAVYAKLIGQVVAHWLTLTGAWVHPNRSLWKAVQAVQTHAPDLARTFDDPAAFQAARSTLAAVQHATCRLTTRRTRPNTCQLLASAEVA